MCVGSCAMQQTYNSHELWHRAMAAWSGGKYICPYSQQRLMRTSLSGLLGLFDNGQYKSTSRLLVRVPHGTPHGTMGMLEELCMPLPKHPK